MNVFIGKILNTVLFTASPKIAISIEKSLLKSINGSHKAVTPNVKFSTIYKQWLLNVFLNNHRPILAR